MILLNLGATTCKLCWCFPCIHPPTTGYWGTDQGKFWLPLGFFMRSSAVTTCFDVIWKKQWTLLPEHQGGHRAPRINKIHRAGSLQMFSSAWNQTRKVGILDWGIFRVENERKRAKGKRTVTERYPPVAHDNSKKHSFLWWHLVWHLSTSIPRFNLFH